MTRQEQHKARKRKEKGRYYDSGSGVIYTLIFVGVNAKRHATFYISKVEED